MNHRIIASILPILLGCLCTEQFVAAAAATADDTLAPILTYQPTKNVKSDLYLAKDLHDMHKILSKNDTDQDDNLAKAYRIYTQGGYAASRVRVTLHTPLAQPLPHGTVLSAMSHDNGHHVNATTTRAHDAGENVLDLAYDTSVPCYVGGLEHQTWEGCFQSPGHLRFEEDSHGNPTFYFVRTEHWNNRTLQSLSTNAHEAFRQHDRYYDEFQQFHDYYGSAHYADHMIQAAFNGTKYKFAHQHFNFSHSENRDYFVQKAAAYVSVNMYMIRELEEAITHCHKHDCHHDDCHALHSLDAAVALYTGALQENEDDDKGNFLFGLANQMCRHFHTCSSGTHGTANINHKILYEMKRLQAYVRHGQCSDGEDVKNHIVRHMYVPLFQGLIYSAFQEKKKDEHYKKEKGAVFAAATMPRLATCSLHRAKEVHDQFTPGHHASDDLDFEKILSILQDHYECMGLKCDDIGGIWDDEKHQYHEHAQPCTPRTDDESSEEESSSLSNDNDNPSRAGILGGVIAALVVCGLCAVYSTLCCSRRSKNAAAGDGIMVTGKTQPEQQVASSSSTTSGSDNSLDSSDDVEVV